MARVITSNIEDIGRIQEIAQETWRTAYQDMISAEQIEYMLELFYNTNVLSEQIRTKEQTYLLLLENDIAVGFASFGAIDNGQKLHKLYCLPQMIGKGYGKELLKAVEKEVLNLGCNNLELNVNRNNPAKRFYTREGYKIKGEVDLDIGGGFFMNDYIMSKSLP